MDHAETKPIKKIKLTTKARSQEGAKKTKTLTQSLKIILTGYTG
jgi:hypothetical protein